MTENNIDKSQKTQDRIELIKFQLKLHRKSVKRLKACFENRRKNNKAPYAPRVVKYSSLPRSEKVYQFTLQNITSQISLLERELFVLIQYGT